MTQTPTITITPAAISHFGQLIEKEAITGMGLRIFVDNPGPKGDVSIAFCPPGEHRAGDVPLSYEGFTLYVDRQSVPYLEEAHIDYQTEGLGGQLSITAPHLRGAKLADDAPLADKINVILQTEINPNLASHGGVVSLVEITPENAVVLRFGGGCHGCGMVDVTLKEGIEKAIMTQCPEVTAVIDATDHATGENPYFTHHCA